MTATPAQRAAEIARDTRKRDRAIRQLAEAQAIAAAAIAYRDALIASDGIDTQRSDYARLQLDNAIIDALDDGDCIADRENIMLDRQWDEHGNPERFDRWGDRLPSFDAGLVHPDDGCQRKGFAL